MKILVLDAYPQVPYRVAKDNNGGYGTANDLGDGLVPKLLTWVLKQSMDYPPLPAVTIMGQLRDQGHEVAYSRVILSAAYDVFIVPSSIVAHESEIAAIQSLRKLQPNAPILVIGSFASSIPQPYIDAGATVIAGEAEVFFQDFTYDQTSLNALPSLYQAIGNLDLSKPMIPAWDIVFKTFKPKLGFLSRGLTVPIIASRGCPYSCSHYCVYPLQQGKKVRSRAPSVVVSEMTHLYQTLGIKNFQFRDPVFTINRKYIEALCHEIIRTNLGFSFAAEFHLKDIDESLANLLYRAGLRLAFVGIESVSSNVLSNAKRMTIPVDEQSQKVKLLQKAGVKVKAMYIFGLPTDNDQSITETIKYALNLNSDYGQFSIFTPYPGTPVFKEYEDKIVANTYEAFTQWQLVFTHPNLSAKDIRRYLSKAYTTYYTNPKWLIHKVSKMLRIG